MTDIGPVVDWECDCRTWPIAVLWPIGRCGNCEVRPRPIRRDAPSN